jgi:hypothetical protein
LLASLQQCVAALPDHDSGLFVEEEFNLQARDYDEFIDLLREA